MTTIVKECKCGRAHDADAWGRLEWVGPMDDGEGDFLILRNCECGSTIAVPRSELISVATLAPTQLPPPPLG